MWRHCAEWALRANKVDPGQFCSDVWNLLEHGRCERLPVVGLCGRFGGEGKSFCLAPLREIYGKEYAQPTPQPGSFPFLGIETKRLAILDEWTFDESTLPLATQLLRFEGKSRPATRPQNNNNGRYLYEASAPVFITCSEKHVGPTLEKGRSAAAMGLASEHTMLMRRLRIYGFSQQLPMATGARVPECGAWFARMIMERSGQGQA